MAEVEMKKCARQGCGVMHSLRGDFCSLRCAVLFAQEIGLYETRGLEVQPDGSVREELGH